jgi:hypothetical protein
MPGQPNVRTIMRWKKEIPDFLEAANSAGPASNLADVNDATPVEILRELAKSPREDTRLKAASKLADIAAKAAIEQASIPARGATIFVAVQTDGTCVPHEVESVIRDLEPGAQPQLHLESAPLPAK